MAHYNWDQPSYCEAETTGIVVYLRGLLLLELIVNI